MKIENMIRKFEKEGKFKLTEKSKEISESYIDNIRGKIKESINQNTRK